MAQFHNEMADLAAYMVEISNTGSASLETATVAALLGIVKELADIKVILSDMQRDTRDIGHIISEISNPPDSVGNDGSLNVRIRTGVEV